MAWIDDRIWCHPKFVDLSDRAHRVYVDGLAYSAGFSCRGHLSPGQQRKIGSDAKARRELIEARLWDENGDGASVYIHDWDDHNGKRDARREADRVRKANMRASAQEGAD